MLTAGSVRDALEAACGQVRPGGPDDAVAGAQPSFVAAPASVDEASAVLRAAAALGLAVLPRGGGTKLGWGAAPVRCDLIVETRLMSAVIEHAAGDLVARVQAGVPAERLSAVLAAAGQRLALDPPAMDGSETIGGLLATGVAGPLRLRYGTPRDLLIGITVVRADGAVTRSGGKVVKNVAGYDLCKLYAGSYGTLGLIAEAAFRLHPLPAAAAFVTLECADPAAAQSLLTAAVDSPLAPVAAELDRPGSQGAGPDRDPAGGRPGWGCGACRKDAPHCRCRGGDLARAAAMVGPGRRGQRRRDRAQDRVLGWRAGARARGYRRGGGGGGPGPGRQRLRGGGHRLRGGGSGHRASGGCPVCRRTSRRPVARERSNWRHVRRQHSRRQRSRRSGPAAADRPPRTEASTCGRALWCCMPRLRSGRLSTCGARYSRPA